MELENYNNESAEMYIYNLCAHTRNERGENIITR